MSAKPLLIAIIEHDIEHPVTPLDAPPYRAEWLAFNSKTRRVLVEVEADEPAGLQKFRADYRGHFEVRADHSLPEPAGDWQSLVGEREAGDERDDPLKAVKRRDRMRRYFDEEDRRRSPRQLAEPAAAPAQPAATTSAASGKGKKEK